jgi:hypothetical protein
MSFKAELQEVMEEALRPVVEGLRQLIELQRKNHGEDIVSVQEAARRTGISEKTILRRLTDGTYTDYKNGSRHKVSLSQIWQIAEEDGRVPLRSGAVRRGTRRREGV